MTGSDMPQTIAEIAEAAAEKTVRDALLSLSAPFDVLDEARSPPLRQKRLSLTAPEVVRRSLCRLRVAAALTFPRPRSSRTFCHPLARIGICVLSTT